MNVSTVLNEKDGALFEQQAGDTILRSALRAGLGFSYECNSGGCGACKFKLISGDIKNLWPEAPGLTERDKKKGNHLACQCCASGPIVIQAASADEYRPKIRPQRQIARLLGKEAVTHDLCEFRFMVDGAADFLPGQYAMLDLPGVSGSRAYSFSNIANPEGQWHFQIRRVARGQGTQFLFETLSVGDEIVIDGPYGTAYLRDDSPRDIVCVAGGSGLAPMLSIARGAAAGQMLENRKLYFFYGARTVEDICGETQMRQLNGFGEAIHYIPVVSQPPAQNWLGASGFVHEIIIDQLPEAPKFYEFYFAGPPLMTQALQELLMLEHQVPFSQIHFDRFF